MFLRAKHRRKNGKDHRYWSIVENRRVAAGRVVQRQVLYLGEINDSQHGAWCRAIEVVDETADGFKQVALVPEDRRPPPMPCDIVQVRLDSLSIRRPRQWGACWLALELWNQLELDRFWSDKLLPSRKGTDWLNVLKTLTCYRLIDPGSEWRLHILRPGLSHVLAPPDTPVGSPSFLPLNRAIDRLCKEACLAA